MRGEREFDAYAAARSASLYRTAVLLLGGDAAGAADAVQNTMLELWRRWPRVRTMERADGYAHKVLVTQVLRSRRGAVRLVPTLTIPDRPVEDVAVAAGLRSEMWEAVRTLPPVQRAVVVLRFYEDLTEAQTADALGIAVGTVKSHSARALTSLRAALGVEFASGGSHD